MYLFHIWILDFKHVKKKFSLAFFRLFSKIPIRIRHPVVGTYNSFFQIRHYDCKSWAFPDRCINEYYSNRSANWRTKYFFFSNRSWSRWNKCTYWYVLTMYFKGLDIFINIIVSKNDWKMQFLAFKLALAHFSLHVAIATLYRKLR